jgi:hypothetical protein
VLLSGTPALLVAYFWHDKAAEAHAAPRLGTRKIGQDTKKVEGWVFRFVRFGGTLSSSVRFNNTSY